MKKIVVLLSGGMDSTTLLHELTECYDEVAAISFNYGQRHKKELEYAKKTCKKLGVEHKIVDISVFNELIDQSSLTGDIPVPHGHYEEESMKQTVVPNRNMILIAMATAWAVNKGYENVAYAAHSGDHAIYPDCTPGFFFFLDRAINQGNYGNVHLRAPYINMDKTDIAEIGLKMGIDYDEETWTCYEGKDEPCGKCGACIERAEALELAQKRIDMDKSRSH